jgi:hypothetical protein
VAIKQPASGDGILLEIESLFPKAKLRISDSFRWSPEENIIYYDPFSETMALSLLHEVGHMICSHQRYSSDIGLLRMEVEAWQKAREYSKKIGLTLDEDHVEKCLDSYREWIYRRSSCPLCTQAGVERETGLYSCINCQKKWRVTPAKFCRVYRKSI